MKQQPNTTDPFSREPVPRKDSLRENTEEPAENVPERTVDALLSSFPMKRAVALPQDMRVGLTLLCVVLTLSLLLGTVVLLVGGASFFSRKPTATVPADGESVSAPVVGGSMAPSTPGGPASYPYADGPAGNALLFFPESVIAVEAARISSSNAVLVDMHTASVVASRLGDEPIYPASMTKVMTLIVIAEHLPQESSLQDVITVSQEVFDRMIAEGSSLFGFEPGMQLTVEALLYALMLKSDGIAACELARYVAGSEAAFVDLMNEKAAAMGLRMTHFENPTGLHHPDHKTTAREMASIMAYAMCMKLCRRVMTAGVFRTTITDKNGEQDTYAFYNNLLVTQFERVDPHHPTGMTVLAGKTGYTPESGTCLVTYAETKDGHGYICVTANTQNYASCIRDYITLYNTYANP